MLFGFRWMRGFQIILALAAVATGIGAAFTAKAFSDDGNPVALIPAAILGITFLWCFQLALRMPTSFVAVGDDKTRIRFAGFVDTIIANRDITDARLARHPLWGGLGVRLWFGSTVALATAPGEVAELEFRAPVRVWLIPRLLPLKAQRLRLSVRNPGKLVDRLAAAQPAARPAPGKQRKKR